MIEDDVDFFVRGVEPGIRTTIETVKFIENYKKRPDYRFEVEEAERILADLGMRAVYDRTAQDPGFPVFVGQVLTCRPLLRGVTYQVPSPRD